MIGALSALAVVAAPAARATTAPRAIGILNQQRAANGIPPDLREDPVLTEGCREYDHYRALNPNDPPHQEIPGHPGYTPLGAGEYGFGYSEVNAPGDTWTATTNPWDDAPIHQSLMFDPSVTTAGYAFAEGTACMRFAGYQEAAGPTFYSCVSDSGPGAVNSSESAAEWPYVPQQLVGIPADATTGPNILVFATGFRTAHIVSVSLVSADGLRVADVRFVDHTTPGVKGFFWNAADVIPAQPLRAGASYTLTLKWTNDVDAVYTQTVSFVTPRMVAELEDNFSSDASGEAGDLEANSNSPAAITATIRRLPSRRIAAVRTLHPGDSIVLHLPGARYEACFTQLQTAEYTAPAVDCQRAMWRSAPRLRIGRTVRRGNRTLVPISASSSVAGVRATIYATELVWTCNSPRFCYWGATDFYRRSFRLAAHQTLAIPYRRPELVAVHVPESHRGEYLFDSADVTKKARGSFRQDPRSGRASEALGVRRVPRVTLAPSD